MKERDLVREFRDWLEEIEHHEHHHQCTVSVLLGYGQGKEIITMAEQVLNVSPPVVTVNAALGSVRDANGTAVIDPVASGTWTADDSTVGSIAAATDGTLNAVVTLLEVAGTLNVTFSGTTTSGAAVTGAAQIVVTTTVSASGTTTVDVTLTPV